MYLFFDTETTGTPKNYKAPVTDLDNWPRVTQLAAILYDGDGKVMDTLTTLIQPDGWEVPKEKFFIDHNMSTERCQEFGYIPSKVFTGFAQLVDKCEFIIAHNIDFDLPVVQAEMIRYGVRAVNKPKRFCTMKSTTDFCQLPGARFGGNFKFPKLEELHRILFKEEFDGAHDALVDVRATARCFFELKNQNIITLP